MKYYSAEEFLDSIRSSGITQGDTVLVHASLFSLGMLKDASLETLCAQIYGLLRQAVGKEGTLLVPAYFYEYARTPEPFDAVLSPVSKELGVFAQYVAALPDAVRSYNPLTCLAAVGQHAEYICRGGTATGYGVDSPWDRLTRSGGKCLMLGVALPQCFTYCHYIEQMFGVPHMYAKRYTVPIYDNGMPVSLPVITYVRYLDYDIHVDLRRFETVLKENGLLMSNPLGLNALHVVELKNAFEKGIECLKQDISFFLLHPPRFRAGEIPADEKIYHSHTA